MTQPQCDLCPLREWGRGIGTRYCVANEIVPGAHLLFLGMNPGVEEVKKGKPFFARGGAGERKNAGWVLAQVLDDLGLKRGQYSLMNLILCSFPTRAELRKKFGKDWDGVIPFDKPDAKMIRCCAPQRDGDLNRARTGLIVTLGADALKCLDKGVKGKLGVHRGKPRQTPSGLVLPTFHPAYLLRNSSSTEIDRFYSDLEKAYEYVTPRTTKSKASTQAKRRGDSDRRPTDRGPRKASGQSRGSNREFSPSSREDVRYPGEDRCAYHISSRPLPKSVVLDVETWVSPDHPRCDHLRLVGHCRSNGTAKDIPRVSQSKEHPDRLCFRRVVEITGHNVPGDFYHLVKDGCLPEDWSGILDDTMVKQSLKDENVGAALAEFAVEHSSDLRSGNRSNQGLRDGFGADYLDEYHHCVPLWKQGIDPAEDRVRAKNAGDVQLTLVRDRYLDRWLREQPLLKRYYLKFLRPAIRMAADLQVNGMAVSGAVVEEARRLEKRIKYRERIIEKISGEDHKALDLPLTKMVRSRLFREKLLFETLRLPVLERTPKAKKPVLGRSHLEKLHDLPRDEEGWGEHFTVHKAWFEDPPPPVPGMPHQSSWSVLDRYLQLSYLWKQASDLPWLVRAAGGFINPRYNIGGTGKYDSETRPVATGRWSASDPSPQVFAPYLKRHCVSRYPGGFIAQWDASQMEVRIAFQYSRDPELGRIFDSGIDPYLDCSAFLFGSELAKSHRFMGKRCLLATIYGTGAAMLQGELNGDLRNRGLPERVDLRQCDTLIRQLKQKYRTHTEWVGDIQSTATRTGVVESLTGRRRHLPMARKSDKHALNQACNHPIQSLASDLNLLAAICLGSRFRRGVLATLVHDSGVVDLRDLDRVRWFAKKIHSIWKGLPTRQYLGFDLVVPLKIEVQAGKNWGEMKGVEECLTQPRS